MEARVRLLLLIGALSSVSAAAAPATETPAPLITVSICDLVNAAPLTPETYVEVKAQLLMDRHWPGITDDRCPGEVVFLSHMTGGPSISLCEYELGCPANTQDYRVTAHFIGYFYKPAKGAGRMRLKTMRDIQRIRIDRGT
jgi:hypothetical protein